MAEKPITGSAIKQISHSYYKLREEKNPKSHRGKAINVCYCRVVI